MLKGVNSKTVIFNLILTGILVLTLGFNYSQEKALREDVAKMQGPPPTIGSEITDFYVKNEEGQKLPFSDLLTQDTLLVFWSTSCMPSAWSLEALNELVNGRESVNVVPVSNSDTIDDVKAYFREKGWNFPVYIGSDKSAKWAFRVKITPAIYLIDSDRVIKHRQLGLSQKGLDFISKMLDSAG